MQKLFLFLTLIGIIGLLAGCGVKAGESSGDAGKKTEEDQGAVTSTRVAVIDDLLTTIEWIGKTTDEIGLSMDDATIYFNIEGSFLDGKASGSVNMNEKNADGKYVVKEISFTVKNSSISDYYSKLMELYGGVVSEGMEPYAEVNGGAVEWYTFDAGNTLIHIRQGSKVNYLLVTFKKNENPTSNAKLVLRQYAEPELTTLQCGMVMKVTGYEDGILTVEITNQTGTDMTYTDAYILALSSDNGQTYAHLNRMGNLFAAEPEPKVYEIADVETQVFECDLRVFGKIAAGKYMIIMDDMDTEFQLISEDDDTGVAAIAPWFCPECGTKNRDTNVCVTCGTNHSN